MGRIAPVSRGAATLPVQPPGLDLGHTAMNGIRAIAAALSLAGLVAHAGCSADPRPVESSGPARALTLPPPEAARSHLGLAEGFERARQWPEAIRHYELARTLDPKHNQWVARRLGVLYGRVGEPGRAQEEYTRAYRLAPNDPSLLAEIGAFHLAHSRYDDAERILREALRIDPRLRPAWMDLGLALAAQRRYDDAYRAFLHIMTPGESQANLALAMVRNGQDALARAQLRRAVHRQPDLQRFTTVLETIRRQRSHEPSDVR